MASGANPRRKIKCGRCGRRRNVSKFHRSSSRSTGYAALCKDCARVALREYRRRRRRIDDPVRSQARSLLQSAKARAKAKGLPCTLTMSWLEGRLQAGVCQATGVPLDMGAARATPWSASLDQINAGCGYTPENTQVVCWGWNQLKGQDDPGYAAEWIKEAALSISRQRLPK